MGAVAANLLAREGCRLVAISDSKGGVYNPEGLDLEGLLARKKETGSVIGSKNAELLELRCDILVPAAFEHQLVKANASSVKAKVVIEGANNPTTPEADRILASSGIFVVPDILANTGGVIVSYLEWVQGLQFLFWEEAEVNDYLRNILTKAFTEVLQTSQQEKVDMRTAAYIIALRRLATAMAFRGIFP